MAARTRGTSSTHAGFAGDHGPGLAVSLRPVMLGWLPGPAGRLERAREALPAVVESWLQVDGQPLAQLDVPQPGVGSGTAWARMLTVLGEAAGAVARYSQSMRTSVSPDRDELHLLAVNAVRNTERLAAWVVIDMALPIDRQAVIAEADAYLAEVEAEDNGLAHATDAIGALLEARDGADAYGRPVSEFELERHAVEILAPLAAQGACLRWTDDGA